MESPANHGLVSIASQYSVDQTVQRLESLLKGKAITIFALVDHSGEAKKVGLPMRPTKLLIFGSPKGGTPIMQATPTTAIDLPLKALVWEDADGRAWLTYNDPAYLLRRHNFPAELLPNIASVNGLFQSAVG